MTIDTRKIIVQKFGGSSLASIDKVRRVARKIVAAHEAGRPVVAVVSAMGNTTSELVGRATAISPMPPRRELDMLLSSGERMSMALLAMAIQEEGQRAISLTGPQCGIVTDDQHASATIREVRPGRVLDELDAGNIVIVAGYQGESPDGEVTTLGRGGSDTTAVALASALGAEVCEIYSDVAGVFTADPRHVEDVRHLHRVDPLLMIEYARCGARVLHPPCLDLARREGVALRALSTFGGDACTRIERGATMAYSEHQGDEPPSVAGIASRARRIRVRARGADARSRAEILEALADQDLEGAPRTDGQLPLDLLLGTEDVPDAEALAAEVGERLDGRADVSVGMSSVSVVAVPGHRDGLDRRVDAILADTGLADAASTWRRDGPLSVTRAVPAERRVAAIRALHAALVESCGPAVASDSAPTELAVS